MNNSVIEITNSQMILTYVFVAISMIITTANGINRNKDFIIGTIRMTVQLFIAGFVLVYIFDSSSLILSSLMIMIMEGFAIFNIVNPRRDKITKKMIGVISIALISGSIITLVFFMVLVIKASPVYDPQYLIPLGGMIIGNAMTGINLALDNMLHSIENGRVNIEGALMLGASPRLAMDKIIQRSFDTAITPTLNSIKNMGIISLPGMMTGQILGGVSPMIAIRYQIAIMTAIMSSNAIAVFIFVKLGYKQFFNDQYQLIRNS